MDCFWNNFELKRPPLVTINVANTAFAKGVFIAINRYLSELKEPDAKEFAETAALVSRLMARRKNSFHGMIGFRSVRKLNAALCRLLRLDLPRELEHLRGALPDIYDDAIKGQMPTRNNFEYVLVRLLSVHALHERIRECCLDVADYFGKLLRSNFFIEFTTLLIAAVAKINKLSVIMDNKCIALYNRLYTQRQHFPMIDKQNFIPANVELPTQLQLGIQPETLCTETSDNNNVNLGKALNTPKLEKKHTDLGQTIKRKTVQKNKDNKAFNIADLQTVEDVRLFITRENKARQERSADCVTKAILKHEWFAAQKLFERKIKAKESQKGISIFLKFISNKI